MKNVKVAMVDCERCFELERKVNDKLESLSKYHEIIDIKYSGSGYSVPYGTSHVSAMIIYK